MLILAADTSTPYLTVALCQDDTILVEKTELANRQHAEKILLWVDSILTENNVALDDIDLFAVSIGPGSFTGLRVGVSAWKGLAAGINKPILGVPTLDGLAAQIEMESGTLCTILDAKMDEVYAAIYAFESGERQILHAATVDSIDAIIQRCPADTIFIGDGVTKYMEDLKQHFPDDQLFPSDYDAPSAAAIANEAFRRCSRDGDIPSERVAPLYLRKSQAEENRDQQEKSAIPS